MEEIKAYFDRFISLSPAEWSDFAANLEHVKLKKSTIILREGDKCDYLAFIKEGLLRFYYLREGEEKITAFFFAGEFVSNYRSFLTGKPSEHFIQTMKDSEIYLIRKNDLQSLYDKHKNMERLGRFIGENLYLSVAHRLDSFMFASPSERYTELINRNSKLLQEIPQYMIASYLGIKPETLSRIRTKK